MYAFYQHRPKQQIVRGGGRIVFMPLILSVACNGGIRGTIVVRRPHPLVRTGSAVQRPQNSGAPPPPPPPLSTP